MAVATCGECIWPATGTDDCARLLTSSSTDAEGSWTSESEGSSSSWSNQVSPGSSSLEAEDEALHVPTVSTDHSININITACTLKSLVNRVAEKVGNLFLTGSLDGFDPTVPAELHKCFDPTSVMLWNPSRFLLIRKLQDAPRNSGHVLLMHDVAEDRKVVVKKMPTKWFGMSHADFIARHSRETEQPWQDLGCLTCLNMTGYEYACTLHGVFRDADSTYVVFSWATEGDLFTWITQHRPSMGINAEEHLRPLICELLESVTQLHNLSIVHGDLSLENAVLTMDNLGIQLQLIDFAMSSARRLQAWHGGGKVIYNAPELYTAGEHDGFFADNFALGVMIFTMVIGTYPWSSTQPGVCQRFECFKKYGIRALLDFVWKSDGLTSATALSEEFQELLQGMLAVDPRERLTLGEQVYSCGRRSVWCERWVGA